jgi:hypothetical protein
LNALLSAVPDGHWMLYADADELLVYPDCERHPLPELIDYLEQRGLEAMKAPMLDLLPVTFDAAAAYGRGDDFRKIASYFEPARHWRGSADCPYKELYGGIRQRLFWPTSRGNNQMKVPLLRAGRGAQLLSSSHIVSPLRIADIQGAMLHFKFLGDCRAAVRAELERREQPGGAAQWRAYMDVLSEQGSDATIVGSSTYRYESSAQLERLGVCHRGQFHSTTGQVLT